MAQCRATKRDGSRCTLPSYGQQGLCWAHDPKNQEKRRRTASRGGRGKASREVRDLKSEVKTLIDKVEDGTVDPSSGNTIIRAYSVLIDLIKLERGVYLEEDLAARIKELQRAPRDAS